ncbi:MAG: guanylate kinase [Nitrospinota bacterium]
MPLSMYHSATGAQSPHCIHAVGVGKTGAYMVDALLRTGEVEDMLEDSRARFTALAVDIGEQDLYELREYADGFKERLQERGIPPDRAQIRTVALDVPKREELFSTLRRYREFLKMEYPRYYWNPNYEPWLPSDIKLPEAGDRIPRAVAKAIYGKAYYDDKILDQELEDFARSIDATRLPSMVLVFFSLGGGTGSGIVVDLARHLSNVKLGRRIPVIGVGVLPCTADPERDRNGNLFPVINELDCMVDTAKNEGVVAVWGDLWKNPFTGGFLLVPQEHSWQRLQRYTDTGVPEIRHGLRTRVTNKFIDDSLVRFLVLDNGRMLFRVLRPGGQTGAPHETLAAKEKGFTLFDIAKFTHPAVEVLPGEPMSKWRDVIKKWIGYIPQWSGVKEGFKTHYIEAHTFAAREQWDESVEKKLQEVLSGYLLPGEDGTLNTSLGEFFDTLTAYSNIIIPGVAKTDLTAFWEARDQYDKLDWEQKLLLHSWVLELGVMMSEPSIRFEGMAGECIWGCACWVVVPYDQMRGDAPSGAGKDSLRAYLKELGRPYHLAVTATTRPPRAGEKAGVDYIFVSPSEFEAMLQRGELLENAVVYGHRYGVPKPPIREALGRGKDVLLRTDVQGARYIKSVIPAAVTIFVAPPSQEEMERRLRSRATDTPEQMELRLRTARQEMGTATEFDYTVVNDDLARCAAEIEGILARERARPDREAVRV